VKGFAVLGLGIAVDVLVGRDTHHRILPHLTVHFRSVIFIVVLFGYSGWRDRDYGSLMSL
jgi:predicted anti-sigma-YlaC factor YlaD